MTSTDTNGEAGGTADRAGTAAPERPIESSDWDRYGLTRTPAPKSPLPSNKPFARRPVDSHDDLFLEYRRENVSRGRAASGRNARSRANLLAAASVGVAIVLVVALAFVTSGPGPTPSPAPTPTPHHSQTPRPSATPVVKTAYETTVINIGQVVDVPDRAFPADDGTTMYLFGSGGGVAIVPYIGATGTTFKGEPFAAGLPVRSVVAAGKLWVSTAPRAAGGCGPSCWEQSTTYRLNIGTGKVQETYAKTFLVGVMADSVWLATGRTVKRVDPSTGVPGSTTGWAEDGEPRVGCDSLWSIFSDNNGTTLALVREVAGDVQVKSTTSTATAYGPIMIDGQCRLLSGTGGLVPALSSITQVVAGQPGESTLVHWELVLLDSHLWAYLPGGYLQQYDANLDELIGPEYELAGVGGRDPATLFAAMGSVWMIDQAAGQLIGFAVPIAAEASPGRSAGSS